MYLVSVDPIDRLLTILLTQNVFRERIEVILQETLFEPSALLETTVAEAMTKVLEIRDSILERTKKIRQKDESITICPDQDVNQDQFLTTARMEVMTVLLSLIEQEAATPEKLQVSNMYSCMSLYMRWPSTNFYTFSFFSVKSSCALVTRGEMVISPRATFLPGEKLPFPPG